MISIIRGIKKTQRSNDEHYLNFAKQRIKQLQREYNYVVSLADNLKKYMEGLPEEKYSRIINFFKILIESMIRDNISLAAAVNISRKIKAALKIIYLKEQEKFFKENYISTKEITEEINYDLPYLEFMSQLEMLKEKYSYKLKFDRETERYKDYAGYNNIKNQVEELKIKALNLLAKYDFQRGDLIIQALHKGINCYLKKFSSFKERFESIFLFIKANRKENINDITNLFGKFFRSFTNGEDLSCTEQNLKLLEDTIEKCKIRLGVETSVKTVLDVLFKRYNVSLHTNTDSNFTASARNILDSCTSILEICVKEKNLDEILEALLQIEFKDISHDKRIIRDIMLGMYSGVYILNSSLDGEDVINVGIVKRLNENTCSITGMTEAARIGSEEITYENLEANYIPIEEYLNGSDFIDQTNGSMTILYQGAFITIGKTLKPTTFHFSQHKMPTNENKPVSTTPQDKEKLINEIKIYLQLVICKDNLNKKAEKKLILKTTN